jgi:voltage-gated potassium channel
MDNLAPDEVREEIRRERGEILHQLEDWLEMPMVILSIIWLALFVAESIWGLSPFRETSGNVIWIIFGIDFLLKFSLAPEKLVFLRSNLITLLSLALPAFRLFRAFRAFRLLRLARAGRGLRLVRLLTSLNRGMKALGATFGRRGVGYVLALTLIVLFGGAAGMYALETEGGAFGSYSEALWWTAMLLTTMGSDYFPRTGEGRMLCLMLAVYGFAIFGYLTATLATFFINQDTAVRRREGGEEIVGLGELQADIAEIRRLLAERLSQG